MPDDGLIGGMRYANRVLGLFNTGMRQLGRGFLETGTTYTEATSVGTRVRTQKNRLKGQEIASEQYVIDRETGLVRSIGRNEDEKAKLAAKHAAKEGQPEKPKLTEDEIDGINELKTVQAQIEALKQDKTPDEEQRREFRQLERDEKKLAKDYGALSAEVKAYDQKYGKVDASTDEFIQLMTEANEAKVGSAERATALTKAMAVLSREELRDATGAVTLGAAAKPFLADGASLTGNPVDLAQKISAKMADNYRGTAFNQETIKTMFIDLQTMSADDAAKKMSNTKQPDTKQPDAKQPDTKQPDAKQPEEKEEIVTPGMKFTDNKEASGVRIGSTKVTNPPKLSTAQTKELQQYLIKHFPDKAKELKDALDAHPTWGGIYGKRTEDVLCAVLNCKPEALKGQTAADLEAKLIAVTKKVSANKTPDQNTGLSSTTPPVKDDKANTAATTTASLVVDDALLAKLNASLGMGNILTKEGAEGTLASFAGIETNENGVLERNELVAALNSSALIAALANDANKAAAVDKVLTEYGITKSKDLAYADTQAKDLGIANANQAITKTNDGQLKQ